MNTKSIRRQKIKFRVRSKISGTTQKPRLSVFRSNGDIYAQLIDDETGQDAGCCQFQGKGYFGAEGYESREE
jgi:large subunit ribosomal protein L18